jgi:hypothetical protein
MVIIGQTDARSVSTEVMKMEEEGSGRQEVLPVVQIGRRH